MAESSGYDVKNVSSSQDTFDYVIVGAGSAGCVLANRLSADPTVRVLLLEAGTEDGAFLLSVPAGFPKLIGDKRFDWCYSSLPEESIGGRKIFCSRGKLIGG